MELWITDGKRPNFLDLHSRSFWNFSLGWNTHHLYVWFIGLSLCWSIFLRNHQIGFSSYTQPPISIIKGWETSSFIQIWLNLAKEISTFQEGPTKEPYISTLPGSTTFSPLENQPENHCPCLWAEKSARDGRRNTLAISSDLFECKHYFFFFLLDCFKAGSFCQN